MEARTLYDKVWQQHVVREYEDGAALLYVDRHLLHEVSSPQGFAALAEARLPVRRPAAHLALIDHAVPTLSNERAAPTGLARSLMDRLRDNASDYNVPFIPVTDRRQGIVHVAGPELGFTLPGSTLVCGDSHTCTHGAFGSLAFGIGASECGCVLATQCLRQTKASNLRIRIEGALSPGLSIKDVVLALIARIGSAGGRGSAIEYAGSLVRGLSMEGRMTLCNMAVETGSRVAMIAPDDTTFRYLDGRPFAPRGRNWERALDAWQSLPSDGAARFEREVELDASGMAPHVTWGTSPEHAGPVDGQVPDPAREPDPARRAHQQKALHYMGLEPGTPLAGIAINRVFIGSCTNGRIEDLRAAAAVARGRRVAQGVQAIVVPGSGQVREQAALEGLDRVFTAAGFEWRQPGCSLCVAMNGDQVPPGERCASTSNRNFEGRQGPGSRTHLMSPAMAAAAAVSGQIADVRSFVARP